MRRSWKGTIAKWNGPRRRVQAGPFFLAFH
jgi:hypothetical protein